MSSDAKETKQFVNPEFKIYKCPECDYTIVKGIILKLQVQCPGCRKVVSVQC